MFNRGRHSGTSQAVIFVFLYTDTYIMVYHSIYIIRPCDFCSLRFWCGWSVQLKRLYTEIRAAALRFTLPHPHPESKALKSHLALWFLSFLNLFCRNLAVILHVIKGNIGTGILAMPNAFSNSGIVVSTLDTLILASSFAFLAYQVSQQFYFSFFGFHQL